MATVAAPRKRSRFRRRWLIAGGLVVILAIIAGILMSMSGGQAVQAPGAPSGWTTTTAERGSIDATVSATGNVAPEAQAELRFAGEGPVTAILVKPGDEVKAGQALAQIDTVGAELSLTSAQADLAQAQASYNDLLDGATPEQIREAEARLAQAKAQYEQTAAQVSNADITAARARLEQAQARYNQLRAGPKETDLREAEAQLQRAHLALQAERDRLSQAKTDAQLQLDRAVASLTSAQQSYATAKANWDFIAETGQDPTNPESPDPANPGERIRNKLSDTQRQQYYDAFVSAEAALRSAEATVAQARVDYDAARQAEVTGVQTAEQQLASAQVAYDKVRAGAESDQLAEARAAVASAQAELNRLIGEGRASDLAAAQANVEIAQIALDSLKAEASALELASAEAELARARVALRQAERALEQTTLKAPFDATVARVDLRVGEQAGAAGGAIAIVNLERFHINVPVDELDVAQIEVGQEARVALDALPGRELAGRVTIVSPLAVRSDTGTNTYEVTVELSEQDAAVKPGMTATVQIVTERKENVVLVPRRALQTENGQTFVLVPSAGPAAPQQPAGPGAPQPLPGERRPVTLGLSNSAQVEITSGLEAGEQVLVPDVVQTFNPFVAQ